jgi:hypothetical protein
MLHAPYLSCNTQYACMGNLHTGMGAGQPDHVLVNVSDLDKFPAGTEVTIDSLKEAGVVQVSGRERRLPLKVGGGVSVAAVLLWMGE